MSVSNDAPPPSTGDDKGGIKLHIGGLARDTQVCINIILLHSL